MKVLKTLADIACIALACIGVVVICFFIYYSVFNKDITIGVNNVDNQVGLDIVEKIEKDDTLTQEQKDEYADRYFMQANYYSNKNGNGVQLQEMKLNYFTSYKLTSADYRSTGMQYIGDWHHTPLTGTAEEAAVYEERNGFYYYDTTDGISWDGHIGNGGSVATKMNRNQVFIIKIDGRPFSIQLTGGYDIYGDKRFLGFLWKTGREVVGHYYYLWDEVFEAVLQAVKSNSAGTGDYYITLNLSKFFTIQEFDPETDKYKGDTVTDIIKNYSVLKFHYEDNGAIASSQSMFGIIECNPKYDLTPTDYDTTYWQERVVYTLTEKDLSLRYSEAYRGYFASLSFETKKLFATMPRAKVNISIGTNSEYNIVGLDYNAFENFELDTVRITGNGTFHLLEKSLYGTNLKRLERSGGVTFNFGLNAVGDGYSEVVV